jgi:hypothetical protein
MKLDLDDIRALLGHVIPPDDEVVAVWGALWTFGHRLGMPAADVPRVMLDLLLETVGPERTLLLPTYTGAYAGSREFDLLRSPPDTGALSEHALQRPEFRRTHSPINSYAVTGPRRDEVLAIEELTLWGEKSLFGWFGKTNARMCVLGLPWHRACSYPHRAEETLQIPYRYYKAFPGRITVDGEDPQPCRPIMFVRSLHVPCEWDHTNMRPILEREGNLLSGDHPQFLIESSVASVIDDACLRLLRDDPYSYVSNRDEVRAWVRDGKQAEIDQLAEDERIDPEELRAAMP